MLDRHRGLRVFRSCDLLQRSGTRETDEWTDRAFRRSCRGYDDSSLFHPSCTGVLLPSRLSTSVSSLSFSLSFSLPRARARVRAIYPRKTDGIDSDRVCAASSQGLRESDRAGENGSRARQCIRVSACVSIVSGKTARDVAWHTSRTQHARMHARTHLHTHTHTGHGCTCVRTQPKDSKRQMLKTPNGNRSC